MRLFRRHTKYRRLSPTGQLLVAEVEAYLSGNYEEYLRCRACDIPGWSRLNLLAHGDLDRIRTLEQETASSDPRARGHYDRTWTDVQGLLARQLLTLVGDDPAALARIQQTMLVPLELRLIGQPSGSELSAHELVRAAQNVLPSVS